MFVFYQTFWYILHMDDKKLQGYISDNMAIAYSKYYLLSMYVTNIMVLSHKLEFRFVLTLNNLLNYVEHTYIKLDVQS